MTLGLLLAALILAGAFKFGMFHAKGKPIEWRTREVQR